MGKARIGLVALVVGLVLGVGRSRRATARPVPLDPAVDHELRARIAAAEGRIERRLHERTREQRRVTAVLFAMVVLLLVPAALIGTRPDVPEAVVATVLSVYLVIAIVALVVAARSAGSRP